MNAPPSVSPRTIAALYAYFRTVAREGIVQREQRDLAKEVGRSQTVVCHAAAMLQSKGLIVRERVGRRMRYRITPSGQ